MAKSGKLGSKLTASVDGTGTFFKKSYGNARLSDKYIIYPFVSDFE